MQPIVADFGISGHEPMFHIAMEGHEESRTMGTCGYQAPECRNVGYFSVRSDVYAFGVMTLQMLTARDAIVLPGDSHGRQDGVAEELPAWLKRGLNSHLPAAHASNQWMFDPSIEWSSVLLQGLLDLGLKCTEPLIGERPFLSAVEKKLVVLKSELESLMAAATKSHETEDSLCKICLDRRRDTLSIPCRHAAMCQECADIVKQSSGLCPICKGRIQGLETVRGRVQTYMPTSCI